MKIRFVSVVIAYITLFVVTGVSPFASAEDKLVVVTNVNNPIGAVQKKELINLYMGKYAAYSNGMPATPVDIELDDERKKIFYKSLVGLPLARVNAYWSRLKFSGRARPPSKEQTIEDLRMRLEKDDTAIAYLYESEMTNEMKVVYQFD